MVIIFLLPLIYTAFDKDDNIWITDDLINDDASSNLSLYEAQPDEECNDGTNNNMGLVSGANVFVAGSAVFNHPKGPANAISALRDIANNS